MILVPTPLLLRCTRRIPLYAFEGRSPKIDPSAFVASTAVLVGDVTLEAGASVWFKVLLRADYAPRR